MKTFKEYVNETFSDSRLRHFPGGDRNRPISDSSPSKLKKDDSRSDDEKRKDLDAKIARDLESKPKKKRWW